MAETDKKTGVSFECTQKQRDSYIKAAGGRKLGVWIQSVLDEADIPHPPKAIYDLKFRYS